jgi:hypothetical protein
MKYDNLNRSQRAIYNQAITHSHQRRIHVHVETLDSDPVASLTPVILPGGQVAHDVTSDVSTSILTMQFVDATRALNFEPDAGGQSLHRKFQIRVTDSRGIAELEEWIDQDVHTGPVWDFDRQGGLVSLTAHGADRKARGTVRNPRAWGPKAQKTDIIRELLQAAGLTHLGGIPDLPATTGHHVTAGFAYVHHKKHHPASHGHKAYVTHSTGRKPRTDYYLELAQKLAESMNRHLYPNTSGRFVLRSHPDQPILHVNRHLLADPEQQRAGVDAPNTWTGVGDKPKGAKQQVHATAVLPDWHPLSPSSLAQNGKPYVIEERIENPHWKRTAEVRAAVRRHRDRAMRYVVDYEFDMLPVPWLQEFDMVSVETVGGRILVPMKQWTFPLGTGSSDGSQGDPMHVGAVKHPKYRRAA